MVTGIDLVKKQIEIAAGAPLGLKQEDVKIDGHTIECRINAEDPYKNFLPSRGDPVLSCARRAGVRVDRCAYTGYTIPRIMTHSLPNW